MPLGTKTHFIDRFLIRWSGSTLHRSIYLSQQLGFRNVHLLCIALGHFLILMQYLFLEKNMISLLIFQSPHIQLLPQIFRVMGKMWRSILVGEDGEDVVDDDEKNHDHRIPVYHIDGIGQQFHHKRRGQNVYETKKSFQQMQST